MTGLATGYGPGAIDWADCYIPHAVAILVKTVQECILDCLEGTDKIWADRGSMDLRNHGVAPEDTLFARPAGRW